MKSVLLFSKFIFFHFNSLELCFSYFTLILPLVCRMVFSLFFIRALDPKQSLACIYMFSINIMLMEFAIQQITWRINVVRKLLTFVILGDKFCSFFADFAGFSGGCFVTLELFSEGGECLRSDARVVPHIWEPPPTTKDVLPRQICSSFSQKQNFRQILVGSSCI